MMTRGAHREVFAPHGTIDGDLVCNMCIPGFAVKRRQNSVAWLA